MPLLQARLNNFFNATTDLSFNEVIYDFKTRKMLTIVVVADIDIIQFSKNIVNQQLKYQRETINVTIFVNAKAKIYYNAKH